MDYLSILAVASFVLSISLTAIGILSLFRFEKLKALPAFKYLQYFLILIYVFGYYVLWSKVFFEMLPAEWELQSSAKIVSYMGLPFFVVGLLMLLFWVRLVNQKAPSLILLYGLNLTLIAGLNLWFYQSEMSLTTSNLYNLYASGIWLFVIVLFQTNRSSVLTARAKRGLSLIMILAFALHGSFLYPFEYGSVLAPIFNFFFLLVYTAMVVVFIYVARVPASHTGSLSVTQFAARHNLTKREIEVIAEIFKGRTNQEIADSLFISLQTVKDHTSRIYLKSHVKSRGQLMSILRGGNL